MSRTRRRGLEISRHQLARQAGQCVCDAAAGLILDAKESRCCSLERICLNLGKKSKVDPRPVFQQGSSSRTAYVGEAMQSARISLMVLGIDLRHQRPLTVHSAASPVVVQPAQRIKARCGRARTSGRRRVRRDVDDDVDGHSHTRSTAAPSGVQHDARPRDRTDARPASSCANIPALMERRASAMPIGAPRALKPLVPGWNAKA